MLRVITCIVLFFSLATLSGLGATATALMHPAAADACCDGAGAQDHGPAGDPDRELDRELDRAGSCYAPTCLCLSCIPDDLTTPGTPGLPPTVSRSAPGPLSPIHPSDFTCSIEYPPEAA